MGKKGRRQRHDDDFEDAISAIDLGGEAKSALPSCGCKCGVTTAALQGEALELFICHCDMCPPSSKRGSYAGGAPWVALPRQAWSGRFELRRSSPFAQRGECGECGEPLSILYDCEAHTEWVHAEVLPPAAIAALKPAGHHIHVTATTSDAQHSFGDGRQCWPAFEPWQPDLCRPPSAPPPAVCYKCFQLVAPAGEPAGPCVCASPDVRHAAEERRGGEVATAATPPPESTSGAVGGGTAVKSGAGEAGRRLPEPIGSRAELDALGKGGGLVVIMYTASWCGVCRRMAPAFNALPSEFGDVAFGVVDVDESADLAEQAGAEKLPLFRLLRRGKKVEQLVGAQQTALRKRVAKHQ